MGDLGPKLLVESRWKNLLALAPKKRVIHGGSAVQTIGSSVTRLVAGLLICAGAGLLKECHKELLSGQSA
jgi:hypothetical protein